MISVQSNQYSVPKEYIGKVVSYWIIEEKIYICSEHKLIAVHIQSDRKLNYHPEHYVDVLNSHFIGMDKDEILNIAKENLINHSVKIAGSPKTKTLAEFDFEYQPSISKEHHKIQTIVVHIYLIKCGTFYIEVYNRFVI